MKHVDIVRQTCYTYFVRLNEGSIQMYGLNEVEYATLRYLARKRLDKRMRRLHYQPSKRR